MMAQANQRSIAEYVINYLTLRKAIGVLGVALPFVLIIGGLVYGLGGIQSSISSYYHTPMGNVFVGTLCAMAIFFFAYRGPQLIDNIAAWLASAFALGVAFFPTARDAGCQGPVITCPPTIALLSENAISAIHLGCAALFFLTLTFFCLFLFTKSGPGREPTPQKLKRNLIYRICGFTMLGALGLILLYKLLEESLLSFAKPLDVVFWMEAVAIIAFGISWFTKGEGILWD